MQEVWVRSLSRKNRQWQLYGQMLGNRCYWQGPDYMLKSFNESYTHFMKTSLSDLKSRPLLEAQSHWAVRVLEQAKLIVTLDFYLLGHLRRPVFPNEIPVATTIEIIISIGVVLSKVVATNLWYVHLLLRIRRWLSLPDLMI